MYPLRKEIYKAFSHQFIVTYCVYEQIVEREYAYDGEYCKYCVIDDIEDDIKKQTYNPFKENYHQDQFDEYVESLLNLFISEATMAFERLPILLNGDILRNVLYSGVWSRFESVKNKRKKGNMNESV